MGLRFEPPRAKMLEAVLEAGQSMFDQSQQRFKLELDWIKALPGGSETDFVLVSCAGTPRTGGCGEWVAGCLADRVGGCLGVRPREDRGSCQPSV